MCGIIGFRSIKNFHILSEYLPEAVSRLSHRGPDDSGLFFDPEAGLGFGHRRLSIIDLSMAGHQPMSSDDGQVQIIHNGEIYNFANLRKTLESCGHHFQSATDTEVALKAYMEWGIDCLKRFVGMFALAIWDGKEKKLYLARDRLGIKPLYYSAKEDLLLFASELKALMVFTAFERNVDTDAIPLFLHYQYVPAPRTIFKDTHKLLPGHYLVHDGSKPTVHSFWEFPEMADEVDTLSSSEDEKVEELDKILTQAVSDRLVSDVPLGALLSGGIDSSVVVALMQKVSDRPARTFSIGFREREYDEAPWASRVAKHLGTHHTELYVTPKEAMDVIPHLPEIYDEPFADSSAIPTYLVCHLAKTQLTVALSGDGGDEQFAGYARYGGTQAMARVLQHFPTSLKDFLSRLLGSIPVNWVERCYLPWRESFPSFFQVANFPDKWQKLVYLMRQNQIPNLYRATICLWPEQELERLIGKRLPESQYEDAFRETEGWPCLFRLMRVDQRTYLPDAMLTKVDRASMANSLEIRVPLLDHRVVEYTSKLPSSLKYRNGSGKYILRKLLAQYLPSELFERPKMGFGVPIDRWLRKPLKGMLLDYLSSERLKSESLFSSKLIEKKIAEHLSGQANHQYRLWSLLMWEMWRERWLRGS